MTDYKLVPIGPTPEWVANLKSVRIGRMESVIEDVLAAAPAVQAGRDAARYRWLRDQIVMGPLTIATADSWELRPWSGDDPDAAIDAAMAEQEADHG